MGEFQAMPAMLEQSTKRRSSGLGAWLAPWIRAREPAAETPATVTSGGGGRGPGDSPAHEELRARIDIHRRRVFVRIDRYLLLSRIESEWHRLDGLVQSLLLDAQECFMSAALLAGGVPRPTPVQQACLDDLEAFLQELRACRPMPALDVMHALDSLLVHCVLLDPDMCR